MGAVFVVSARWTVCVVASVHRIEYARKREIKMPPRVKLKVPRVKLRREDTTDCPPPTDIRTTSAIQCVYCKHWYLKPCSDVAARDQCQNWQHLQDARLIDRLAAEYQQSQQKKVKRVKRK